MARELGRYLYVLVSLIAQDAAYGRSILSRKGSRACY